MRRVREPLGMALCRLTLTALVSNAPVPPRSRRRAERASQALLESGRLDWACRALAQEGRIAILAQEWLRAGTLLATAYELGARSVKPVPASVWANLLRNAGYVAWTLGNVKRARINWQGALDVAQEGGLDDVAAAAHTGVGLCDWAQGDAAAGYVHASAALSWYRSVDRRTDVAQGLLNAALMLEDFGYWQDVVVLLSEALDVALSVDEREIAADASAELVHAHIALSRLPAAHEALGRARQLLEGGSHTAASLADLNLAEGHLRLAEGRVQEALWCFRAAREAVGSTNRPLVTGRVLTEVSVAIHATATRLDAAREMVEVLHAMDRRSLLGPPRRVFASAEPEPTAVAPESLTATATGDA